MSQKFQNDLQNQELPYTMEIGTGSKTLLITFAGISGAIGLYPFEFFKTTQGFDIDKIFIRDLEQAWYHKGMKGISDSIETTAKYLKSIIKSHNYKKVVCLGNSMGGYAAIVIGHLIKADTVLAFAPQTFLDTKNRQKYGDNRWKEQISALPKEIDKKYLDLSKLLISSNDKTKINIYYSLDERIDVEHVDKIKKFKNINLYPYKDGGHQLVQLLRKSGHLYRILRNSLTKFSEDRIVAIFDDLENNFSLEESLERNSVKKDTFLKYRSMYKNSYDLKGTILESFFKSIEKEITKNSLYKVVDDFIKNRKVHSLEICTQWFNKEKKTSQMFGTYIDFAHPKYLLRIKVGTKHLHIGLVKYIKENAHYNIVKMDSDDIKNILSTYNKNLPSNQKLTPRSWGSLWCSVDCGSIYDLAIKDTFSLLNDFTKSNIYKNIFIVLLQDLKKGVVMQNLISKHIFTPGPVKMSKDILAIGGMQTPYFRNNEFSEILLDCEKNLLKIVNAPQGSRVLFLTASGTAGMEAAVQNLLNKEDKIVVINGGTFGQRFVDICAIHDLNHVDFKVNNDNLCDTKNLKKNKNATALLINAHETSIGLLYDLHSIGNFCKKNNIFNIVDAISMFVTDKLDMCYHNIDALIISSHKGLALPPGLSMVILSPKAVERVNPRHQLYFDFNSYINDGKRGQTPFTPAVTIILQLQARLQQIIDDGIESEINKAKEISSYFRDSIKTLPLKAFSNFMPNALTTLTPTDDKSASTIVKDLDEKYNVVVAPNGGALKDKAFRVSHMGAVTKEYTDILIDALFNYYGRER